VQRLGLATQRSCEPSLPEPQHPLEGDLAVQLRVFAQIDLAIRLRRSTLDPVFVDVPAAHRDRTGLADVANSKRCSKSVLSGAAPATGGHGLVVSDPAQRRRTGVAGLVWILEVSNTWYPDLAMRALSRQVHVSQSVHVEADFFEISSGAAQGLNRAPVVGLVRSVEP